MTVSNVPMLTFEMMMPYGAVKELIKGKLITSNAHRNFRYEATSGCPRFQYEHSQNLKGRGPIPRPIDVGIHSYTVQTTPLYLPNVKGIEGNGYPIAPMWVEVKGVKRGDFLIHNDRNLPGSAGCIVLTLDGHWKTFESWMTEMRAIAYKAVQLNVVYKYV